MYREVVYPSTGNDANADLEKIWNLMGRGRSFAVCRGDVPVQEFFLGLPDSWCRCKH